MPALPWLSATPLVRTDFGNDGAWAALLTAARTPSEDGFLAMLHVVDDPVYAGLGAGELLASLPGDADIAILLAADAVTLTRADLPVLVVDALITPGRTFRVTPSELWAVENNLSLANMDWEEFADRADGDGVYRGL